MPRNDARLNGAINISPRASADYRRHIVGGLFKDVVGTAWKRAA